MRRSGKTTRMLNDAVIQARNGRAVYVVADTKLLARMLECTLDDMLGEESKKLGIKFESAQSLSNFDWMEMRLYNAHPNCVVLVDHYAIECKFGFVLEMLHRYDIEQDDNDVSWKRRAVEWLREKANEQVQNNERWPEHTKCYPTWTERVRMLQWLAEELESEAEKTCASLPDCT